jgi:Rrf2 family transcriptional regulator, iron-sulfur cluster assembly transcription factor
MRLSSRGRFAINAMIDLALRNRSEPVPLAELAARHHISLSYLEQMFAKLRENGLVDSTRGPGGGYTLGFRGDHITVADIVTAIEGEGDDRDLTHGDTTGAPDMTHELWDALHSTLLAYLKTVTLHQLATEQRVKGFAAIARKAPSPKPVAVVRNPAVVPVVVRRVTKPSPSFALGQVWGSMAAS